MQYITAKEASKILNKSPRTITRYIEQGKLNPKQGTSDKGTPINLFSLKEINKIKDGGSIDKTRQDRTDTPDETDETETPEETPDKKPKQVKGKDKPKTEETGQSRQDRTDKTSQTGQTGQGEVITLLRENQAMLKGQLDKKDKQIEDLNNQVGKLNNTLDSMVERNKETNI